MKYLLILAVVLVCIWFWRNNRGAELRDAKARKKPPAGPASTSLQTTEVIACSVCAVHLPRSEALPGGRGFYCSDAHRREAEG